MKANVGNTPDNQNVQLLKMFLKEMYSQSGHSVEAVEFRCYFNVKALCCQPAAQNIVFTFYFSISLACLVTASLVT